MELTLSDLFIIFSLIGLGIFWWNNAGAYEKALQTARQACQKHQLKLLDDTLQLKKIRFSRHQNGSLQFSRMYLFEFISDGEIRYHGKIFLAGIQATKVEFEAYRIADITN